MTEERYYYGTGKRKNAIAKVRLYPGDGGVIVKNKPLEETFPWENWRAVINYPLQVTGMIDKFKVVAKVHGGGVVGQAGAMRHGVARALLVSDESLRRTLRQYGLLTRDSRIKESKKYGLKRARRAPQYTKR